MEALELARVALARKMPYFAHALYNLRLVKANSLPHAILAAKDWVVYYQENHLNEKQVLSYLYHELSHLLRDHALRANGRHPNSWNQAADLELYRDAWEQGLALGSAPSELGLPANLMAEQYYALLNPANAASKNTNQETETKEQQTTSQSGNPESGNPQEQQTTSESGNPQEPSPKAASESSTQQTPKQQSGSSSDGIRRTWETEEGLSESTQEMIKDLTALEVLNHISSQGDLPLGLLRWAKERLEPKVDWQRKLKSKIRQGIGIVEGATRASFHKRHRRQGMYQVILPGRYSLIPKIAVVIDTSGSISNTQLSRTVAEVQGILRELKGHRIEIMSVDAQVQTHHHTNRLSEVELKGGGGTNMGQGIAAAEKARCDLCIVITDFFTPWPDKAKLKVIGLSLVPEPQPAPSYVEVIIASGLGAMS